MTSKVHHSRDRSDVSWVSDFDDIGGDGGQLDRGDSLKLTETYATTFRVTDVEKDLNLELKAHEVSL